MDRLEMIDGQNWEAFLGTEELHGFLAEDRTLIDKGGLVAFKRANPWLAEVDVLPYTLVYRNGEKVSEFAGGGIGRLQSRLERLKQPG